MFELVFDGNKGKEAKVKVFYFEQAKKIDLKKIEKFLGKDEVSILKKAIEDAEFTGKEGSFAATYTPKCKIVVCGLGEKPKDIDLQKMGEAMANRLFKNTSAIFYVENESEAYNIALGLELGSYAFDKYFTTKKKEDFSALETVYFAPLSGKLSGKGYNDYKAIANAVRYAKDLVNEPANYLTPEVYATDILRLNYLGLKIDILDKKDIEKNKMGLLLGVSLGSINEPRVAILQWQGDTKKKDFDVAFVGKGVTFDTGGINLKPSAGMADMKGDMAGSAAVVAALKALALQKAKINVIGAVGLVENMPSGSAIRPSDVLKSMSGQTVEVGNTDAEGRLVLADVMWYVQDKFKVKKVIDIATLTGVTSMVFAGKMAAVFSNDDKFVASMIKAGQSVDEILWHMPVTKEYDKMLKSSIADMNNIAGKAGSCTAACFLQRFVKKGVSWAHIDIAGCEANRGDAGPAAKGATGFGVKLLHKIAIG